MKRGRHTLAIESFEHVVDLDPRHPGAWHGIGMAYRELGDHSASLSALLKAVEFGPEAVNPRIDAAAALLDTDPAHALELVETGAAMHPEDARMAAALRIIRSQAGQ
jgi:tetratricopeptide (TPR) repeat protein